jgi:hypothetical protein
VTPGADGADSAASGGATEVLADDERPVAIPVPAPWLIAPVGGGRHGRAEHDRFPARSSLERIVEQASELTRRLRVRRLERDLGTAVIMSGADFC